MGFCVSGSQYLNIGDHILRLYSFKIDAALSLLVYC